MPSENSAATAATGYAAAAVPTGNKGAASPTGSVSPGCDAKSVSAFYWETANVMGGQRKSQDGQSQMWRVVKKDCHNSSYANDIDKHFTRVCKLIFTINRPFVMCI